MNVVTPAEAPAWAVPYGREFWRHPAIRVEPDPKRSGTTELPASLNIGDVIERVGHAFRQNGSADPEGRASTYTASLEAGQLSFSPHRPQEPSTVGLESAVATHGPERRPPDLEGSLRRASGLQPDPTLQLKLTTSVVRQNDSTLYSLDRSAPASVVGNTAQRLLNTQVGLVEHFEMRDDGAHLTWILGQKPAGAGPVTIEIQASGLSYAGATGHGHHFADAQGMARVRVGNATAVDANGRSWPLTVSFSTNVASPGNAEVNVSRLRVEISADLLAQTAYPLAVDPIISPEFGMDDPVFAFIDRFHPAVAANGGMWLVVWTEARILNSTDIYGARVSGTGAVLDFNGIPISTAADSQQRPAVAANGTDWLVVWDDKRGGSVSDIYGTRVNRNGTVLNSTGIPISTAANNQLSPAVSANGTNWLVVWGDFRSGSSWDIYGTRVNGSGTVLNSVGVAISTAANDQIIPAVAANGTDWLVVWEDERSGAGAGIFGARINASGTVLNSAGIPIRAASATAGISDPAVAASGTNWLVAWQEYQSASQYDIVGSRVSGSGTVLDSTGIVISSAASFQYAPAVAGNSNGWMVVWYDLRSGDSYDIYGAIVGGSGSVVFSEGLPISTGPSDQNAPMVAADGNDWLVVWWGAGSGGPGYGVYGARIRGFGTILDSNGIWISASSANGQDSPAVAGNGTDWLVVWRDYRNSGTVWNPDIFGTRINRSGTVLDPGGIAISTDVSFQYPPAVAANGTNWLVVWQDYRNGDWDIYGRLVSGSGPALVGSEIPISLALGSQYSPAVAANGTNWLVVWGDGRGIQQDIYGTRVSQGGTVLDASGIPISTATNSKIGAAVAANGSDWLVVWGDLRNSGTTSEDIYGTRVSQGGTVLDASGIPISTATNSQYGAAVAANGSDWLVVWQDNRSGVDYDIYGTRVNGNGMVMNSAGIAISIAAFNQRHPAVAANGANWFVVWEDYRSGSNLENLDIYGTRIDANGTILPDNGVPISTAEGYQFDPAIAANSPVFLILWSATRVEAKFLTDPYSQAVIPGDYVEYGVLPSSQPYQWRRDGVPIPNATNASYVVTSASALDAGLYDVVQGVNTNGPWALTVFSSLPNQTTNAGSNVTFSATYSGPTNGLMWSWTVNGETLPNANLSSLTLTNVAYDAQVVAAVAYPGDDGVNLTAQLAVTYVPGQEIRPPLEANLGLTPRGPIAIPSESVCTNQIFTVYALQPGPFTLIWTNFTTNALIKQARVLGSTTNLVVMGEKVPPPPGFNLGSIPQDGPIVDPPGAAYWHNPARELYAVTNGPFGVTWAALDTNSCPRVPVQYLGTWPSAASMYQIHVAGSQAVDLSAGGVWGSARLLQQDPGATSSQDDVRFSRLFSNNVPGRALLLLAPDPTLSSQTANIHFQFVRTVSWNDINHLTDRVPATIGSALIPNPGWHNTNHGGAYVLMDLSRYCTVSNYYNRAARTGPIIPVNRDQTNTTADDMVVVYYEQGTRLYNPQTRQTTNSNVGWPYKPVRYDVQWPATPDGTIVIASQKGTGPLNLGGWQIYYQNDANSAGFNPNEEHAFPRPAKGRLPSLRISATAVQVGEGSLAEQSTTNELIVTRRIYVTGGGAAQVELRLDADKQADQPTNKVVLSVASGRNNASNVFASFSATDLALEHVIPPATWSNTVTLHFGALPTTNTANSSNVFTVRASGAFLGQVEIVVEERDTNHLVLVLGATRLAVPENGFRSFPMRLNRAPAASVAVDVNWLSGHTGLTVQTPMPLVFTPSDWATPRFVSIAAASDADVEDGEATFSVLTSGGLVSSNALVVTEADQTEAPDAAFALRNDLGDPVGTATPQTSEPYVLLTYTNAQGQPKMAVYQVVAEDAQFTFRTTGKAGRMIQPPYPLSDFLGWQTNSSYTSGPGWQDRRSNIWARAAGSDGGATNVVTKYFYPFLSSQGFYLPPGYSIKANGWVPWLDRRTGVATGVPTDYTNVITWPDFVPELRMGESLVKVKFGLPSIRGQTSVDILYEQTQALGLGSNSSAQVIDIGELSQTEYSVALATLPEDIAGKTVTNLLTGEIYFSTLPPHLRSRVWFDGNGTNQLKFKGQFLEEFGLQEPVGYLLLNVITARDMTHLLALSVDPVFRAALTNLETQAAAVRSPTPTTPSENLALTAGLARGNGYVTLAFNNVVDSGRGLSAGRGEPVSLEIIRVTCPNYVGDTKVIYPPDPFDSDTTLRHSGDFGGVADRYIFEWQDHAGPGKPATNSPVWATLALESGGLDQLIRADGRRSLGDWWYRCRWRATNVLHPCSTDWSAWTEPALVEGWIKRVIGGINFFDQRYKDLVNSSVDTVVNVLSQSGTRWNGSVPLNAQAAAKAGLIEIYETVLKRAIDLSIEGTPPVEDAGVNLALTQMAAQLANIYLLFGNEAYADAANPTIGITSPLGLAEVPATSLHSFMDQLGSAGSLLEEELALLRGLDDSNRREVRNHPIYHRLPPNMFSGALAEPVYVLNYDITDVVGAKINDPPGDGITALDAQRIWPQGHGDAWGHYVMAGKNFYRLLQNPRFTWKPTVEFVNLAGRLGTVPVNYQHERKFAAVAAAKARTGAEIVNLTYRSRYVEAPGAQMQNFSDADTNRAWGVDDWARRAGQGALFDWVVGNALLPATSAETGIAKVDRTTVTELREVAGAFVGIQEQLDRADAGLNPLGLAKNVVPFDINPGEVDAGKTHFEQIYDRALGAMANAVAVFNNANTFAQKLREQADDEVKFRDAVEDREFDFRNRLIEIFGYPYAQDPAYVGKLNDPDLFHYMYSDYSEITGEPSPQGIAFDLTVVEQDFDTNANLVQVARPVTYHVAANGFGFVKPSHWTRRKAPGEIQMAHSELLQTTARFKRALAEYDNLLAQIEDQAELLQTQYRLNADEINILNAGLGVQERLNTKIARSRSRQIVFRNLAQRAVSIATAIAEALPKSTGFIAGLANGVISDFTSAARSGILRVGSLTADIMNAGVERESLAELDHQQAKESAQTLQNIKLTTLRQEQAILQQIAQLEQLVRQEILLRLEIYSQQEALQQSSGRYASTLAKGQRLLEERLRFRQQTARNVQQYRYKDMAFRIFRNENIQRYRAQFDLAARFVHQAAAAYDYETNLREANQGANDERTAGDTLMTGIVRARSIGGFAGNQPQQDPKELGEKGDGGLAASLYAMKSSWDNYIKGPLGFDNPDIQSITFSLRSGLFRSSTNGETAATWRAWLNRYLTANLLDLPEFQRFCKPPSSGLLAVEPGFVIPFSSSVIFGHNFFGWPEVGGGGNFNPSQFATKIRSVQVKFSGYDSSFGGLSPTPYVYLIPVGNDVLRAPISAELSSVPTREWKIIDQFFPPPISLTSANTNVWQRSTWLPFENMNASGYTPDDFASQTPIRRYALMPASHDSLNSPENGGGFSRLIGRSVWNTRWLLIIPAGALRNDRAEGLRIFIDGRSGDGGVEDILLTFKVYSVSGN